MSHCSQRLFGFFFSKFSKYSHETKSRPPFFWFPTKVALPSWKMICNGFRRYPTNAQATKSKLPKSPSTLIMKQLVLHGFQLPLAHIAPIHQDLPPFADCHWSKTSHVMPPKKRKPLKGPKTSKSACNGTLLRKEPVMMENANVGASNYRIKPWSPL